MTFIEKLIQNRQVAPSEKPLQTEQERLQALKNAIEARRQQAVSFHSLMRDAFFYSDWKELFHESFIPPVIGGCEILVRRTGNTSGTRHQSKIKMNSSDQYSSLPKFFIGTITQEFGFDGIRVVFDTIGEEKILDIVKHYRLRVWDGDKKVFDYTAIRRHPYGFEKRPYWTWAEGWTFEQGDWLDRLYSLIKVDSLSTTDRKKHAEELRNQAERERARLKAIADRKRLEEQYGITVDDYGRPLYSAEEVELARYRERLLESMERKDRAA